MQVRVRNIAAKCPCGASDFAAPHKPPFQLEDRFKCTGCGRRSTYGELLEGIGEEASRQAKEALDELKNHRKKPK